MENIKELLIKLPKDILIKETDLLEQINETDEIILKEKIIKDQTENEVSDEMDGNKKRFSNELKRKLESDRRLNNNSGYIKIIESIKENKKKIKTANIELEFMKRKFRAAESLSRMNEV